MLRSSPVALAAIFFAIGAHGATSNTSAKPEASPSPRARREVPPNRVGSISISQDFMNEQVGAHLKSEYARDVKIDLDPENDVIYVKGVAQVPVEELRAINLDKSQGTFRFQMAVKLRVSKHGHLVAEFPLNETFFYPVDSKDPKRDRVIVPVQMLSIALASARGYLAAIAGDFGGFDRRTAKLDAMMKSLNHSIAIEKNKDVREDFVTQRDSLKIQLAAIPLERKQLEGLAKEYSSLLGFTGEKELNLNDDLAARKNAIVLKLKLSKLVPYLEGVDLGGIRIRHDKKDGQGQDYFVFDINSELESTPEKVERTPSDRPLMKVAPSIIVRLNQALFESKAVQDAESKEMSGKIHDLKFTLEDDGLHASGSAKVFLFISVGFSTIVDFVTTGPDVFEIRVRDLKVAGIDVDFMAKTILESVKRRLNRQLKGICKFKYVGENEEHAHSLRVTVDPKALVPAFPDLHLVNVDVRPGQFIMKIGHLE